MSEHEDKAPEARPAKRQPRTPRLLSVGAVALVVAIAVEGIWHRQSQEKAVAAWTDAAAIPFVNLVHPTKGAPEQRVVLPGDIHAWYEAPLYARVNGYLKNWYFDFGAQVKKGDVLADIDTPEIDAQLAAAKAKLAAASAAVKVREAEAQFAKSAYERWRNSPRGVVSVQEQEAKQAEYESGVARLNAAKADMAVARADVDRLNLCKASRRWLPRSMASSRRAKPISVRSSMPAATARRGNCSASRTFTRCASTSRCRSGWPATFTGA